MMFLHSSRKIIERIMSKILDYSKIASIDVYSHISKSITSTLAAYTLEELEILEEFRQVFLKIKRREPQVRNMPRHKLGVIKLLIFATEPVETFIQNV